MMLVNIGRFELDLIEVESGLIHQVSDLTPHDLVEVEGTPEYKRIFRVIYKLETSLIGQVVYHLHIIRVHLDRER